MRTIYILELKKTRLPHRMIFPKKKDYWETRKEDIKAIDQPSEHMKSTKTRDI